MFGWSLPPGVSFQDLDEALGCNDESEDDMTFPWNTMIKKPTGKRTSPMIYRGGKTSLASWVVSHFPPHRLYVDVFGGGGGVLFAKAPSDVEVYNDAGNVARFFYVLGKYGDELYKRLYMTPWSREEFNLCRSYLEGQDPETTEEYINWARCFFVQISQSYRHEEDDPSWLVSKGVNTAASFASHIDDLPIIVRRLKEVIIENKDFEDVIRDYGAKDTLFYCDPPYLGSNDTDEYRHGMAVEDHIRLLECCKRSQSQIVISGYPSELYDRELEGWKKVEKVRQGRIKNSSQESSERTECLWIKEHHSGFEFDFEGKPQTYVARVSTQTADIEAIRLFRERNGV